MRIHTLGLIASCASAIVFAFLSITAMFSHNASLSLLTLPFCVAAIFTMGMLIAHKTSASLNRLTDTAEDFVRGNYSVQFFNSSDPIELQDLSQTLDRMSHVITSHIRTMSAEDARQKQFISDVSHELRTPLTAIRGTAETLLVNPDIPEEDREHFLLTICQESERLTQLASDLMTLQRIEGEFGQQDYERINPRELTNQAVTGLSALIEDRCVHVEVTGAGPDFFGNRSRMIQVLTNLIENSSRYAGEGAHVVIELSGVSDKSMIILRDDGPGFGDIEPSKLFDRFVRSDSARTRKSSYSGAGLGLAIVKSIIQTHKGTIEAHNLVPHGACFIISLPALHDIQNIGSHDAD